MIVANCAAEWNFHLRYFIFDYGKNDWSDFNLG